MDETAPMTQWVELKRDTPDDDDLRWEICAHCGYAAAHDEWAGSSEGGTVCPDCGFHHK